MRYETRYARRSDGAFVKAAARAIWTDIWLQENGHRLPPRAYIDDFVPETPAFAVEEARKFLSKLLNKMGTPQLEALMARWKRRWVPDDGVMFSEPTAGWYAAMDAMQHGIGLFLFGIDEDLPHLEAIAP